MKKSMFFLIITMLGFNFSMVNGSNDKFLRETEPQVDAFLRNKVAEWYPGFTNWELVEDESFEGEGWSASKNLDTGTLIVFIPKKDINLFKGFLSGSIPFIMLGNSFAFLNHEIRHLWSTGQRPGPIRIPGKVPLNLASEKDADEIESDLLALRAFKSEWGRHAEEVAKGEKVVDPSAVHPPFLERKHRSGERIRKLQEAKVAREGSVPLLYGGYSDPMFERRAQEEAKLVRDDRIARERAAAESWGARLHRQIESQLSPYIAGLYGYFFPEKQKALIPYIKGTSPIKAAKFLGLDTDYYHSLSAYDHPEKIIIDLADGKPGIELPYRVAIQSEKIKKLIDDEIQNRKQKDEASVLAGKKGLLPAELYAPVSLNMKNIVGDIKVDKDTLEKFKKLMIYIASLIELGKSTEDISQSIVSKIGSLMIKRDQMLKLEELSDKFEHRLLIRTFDQFSRAIFVMITKEAPNYSIQ